MARLSVIYNLTPTLASRNHLVGLRDVQSVVVAVRRITTT